MAIKGACHVNSISADTSNPGMVIAGLSVCGLVSGNLLGNLFASLSIDPSASQATNSAALAAYTQGVLTTEGYTFAQGDSVAVFGL